MKSSGNATVDRMADYVARGNMVDTEWYRHLRTPGNKPNVYAANILGDIVYWYRPVEERDESTGHLIGWRKKFKGDLFQKTYKSYADMFGVSRGIIKGAFDVLEDMGIIKRYFRDIEHDDGTENNNVMFIDLFPEELEKISSGRMKENRIKGETPGKKQTPPPKNQGRVIEKSYEDALKSGVGDRGDNDTLPQNFDRPPLEDDHYTKNITENTTEINSHSIYHDDEKERKSDRDSCISIISRNIGYDSLVLKHAANRRVIDRILKIMTDTVDSNATHMFIAKKDRPISEIRDRYLSLREEHIEHVLYNLPEDDTGVVLKDKFLMAYLFNATDTIDQICSTKNLHNKPSSGFMDIEQREYDFAALEREALAY